MAPVIVGIQNGPSKYDLMLALFERSASNPRPVTFILNATPEAKWASGYRLTVHITGVSIEDGSGQSYCFEGQTDKGTVKGWFRTDTREGTIEVECPYTQNELEAHERMGTAGILAHLRTAYGSEEERAKAKKMEGR